MKTVVTIAGTDPTGGAGAQADLKTFMAHEVYGMSILTALVAQNTTGVTSIMNVTPKFLKEQFDCVFTDIRPDAVKIGMVSQPELIAVIVEKLKQYAVERIVLIRLWSAPAAPVCWRIQRWSCCKQSCFLLPIS